MEKKFEQLDHFEKVVTFARQGYGGMTISVWGGTSKADQREAWYQARKKFNDIKLELPEGVIGPIFNDEYGDVTGLLYAVKGDGIGHARALRRRRGHQAAPAQGADGEEGRHLSASRPRRSTSSSRTSGWPRSASRRCMIAESLRNQNSVLPAGSIDTRGDRVLVRVSGQFASLDDIRNVPITAGGRTIKLGDFTTDHARLRGSADLHRAPQRPAGADARHRR